MSELLVVRSGWWVLSKVCNFLSNIDISFYTFVQAIKRITRVHAGGNESGEKYQREYLTLYKTISHEEAKTSTMLRTLMADIVMKKNYKRSSIDDAAEEVNESIDEDKDDSSD